MKLHGHKLLLTQSLFSLQSITINTTPAPPPITWHPPRSTYSFMQSPVVLAVLLLVLLALFLVGCISNCMHPLPNDDTSHPRRRESGLQEATTSSFSPGSDSNLRTGVDPTTVGALPVYFYGGNSDDKCYEITDCAICLSEFEQKEAVKTIPFCKHAFHPRCIETWLSSHVTCPVCRSTRFFDDPDLGVSTVRELEKIWRAGSNDTCIEVREVVRVREQ